MTERNDLISMGFAPERVDWAIRDTPPDADLQTRLDHILENESQPVPSLINSTTSTPLVLPTAYAPPSHPPPSFRDHVPAQHQTETPPAVRHNLSTLSLVESIGQLNIRSPSPVAQPPTLNLEEEAIQRYRDFLAGQRSPIQEAQSSKEMAKNTYIAIMKFFSAEGLKWREQLQLTAGEVGTLSNTGDISSYDVAAVVTLSAPADPIATQESGSAQLEAYEPPNQGTADSEVYDPIFIYDPTRTLLPTSDSMAEVLGAVITGYLVDDPVEGIRKKVREIRPRMTDQISDMRWQALRSTQGDQEQDAYLQRSTQHYNLLSQLQSRGDWNAANRLEEEYKQQESRIRQQENARKHQEYCQTFLNPARDSLHTAFAELHPMYAELQRILEEDNWDLDVVSAVSALEETSDLMEQGMTELETMEDDQRSREFELQRQTIMDDSRRSDPWGDATRLENQKELADVEIKASRAAQKVDRRNPFFALSYRRMEEAIAGVDRDYETLTSAIHDLIVTVPETIPLEQEEARAKEGDDTASKIALPSKLLYNQILEANSSLLSINKMCNDMRDVLKALQRKRTFESRTRDMAQLELNEHRQGRGDSWYFGPGNTLRQQGEKEDEAGEKIFEQERSDRRDVMTNTTTPLSTILTRYKDREMAVLHKLAGGMTANGPMDSASSGVPAAAGDAHTAALAAMQKMYMQQQQSQMISNMMWSQHASRMSVINNIGSSNTQWVVRYP